MAEIDIDSLEPNSHKYKEEKSKNLSAIVNKDQLVSTKKPLGKKFSETFLSEDTKEVKNWIIMDVIVPGIKSTILDLLSMIFFGETDSRHRRDDRRRERYGRIDYSGRYRGNEYDRKDSSRRRRNDYYDSDDRVDFRNIVVRERGDAERVINAMRNRIIDNGSASIADLFDLIDVVGKYTDNNWGWDDERDIGIRRISSGYLIDVAEPKYLD